MEDIWPRLKSTERTNMGNLEAAEPVQSEAGMALEAVLVLEAVVALEVEEATILSLEARPSQIETAVEFWSGLGTVVESTERTNAGNSEDTYPERIQWRILFQ